MVGDLKPRPKSWPGSVRYRQGDLNEMTVQELRAAARQAEAERQAPGNRAALEQVAGYQVEIQKKFALAAASRR